MKVHLAGLLALMPGIHAAFGDEKPGPPSGFSAQDIFQAVVSKFQAYEVDYVYKWTQLQGVVDVLALRDPDPKSLENVLLTPQVYAGTIGYDGGRYTKTINKLDPETLKVASKYTIIRGFDGKTYFATSPSNDKEMYLMDKPPGSENYPPMPHSLISSWYRSPDDVPRTINERSRSGPIPDLKNAKVAFDTSAGIMSVEFVQDTSLDDDSVYVHQLVLTPPPGMSLKSYDVSLRKRSSPPGAPALCKMMGLRFQYEKVKIAGSNTSVEVPVSMDGEVSYYEGGKTYRAKTYSLQLKNWRVMPKINTVPIKIPYVSGMVVRDQVLDVSYTVGNNITGIEREILSTK